MPILQLEHGGSEVHCGIKKVDRSKLYGYATTEILDDQGRPCKLATLANDGRTLIPSGGVALAYLSPNGLWREKSDLTAVNLNGEPIEGVTSTFKEVVSLDTECSVEDFLEHNIRMAYELSPSEDAAFPSSLLKELSEGKIYTFPFSYRGGLVADSAFILQGADETIWMLVGKRTNVALVSCEQPKGVVVLDEDGEEEEEEDLDFNLF